MVYEDYKIHELANAFPLIEGEQFDDLVKSIEERGLLEPIVMHGDVVIDGRNRLRACLRAGVTPAFQQYAGDLDISDFIWTKNVNRRHLDAEARALVRSKFIEVDERLARERMLAGVSPVIDTEGNEAYGPSEDGAQVVENNPVQVSAQGKKPAPKVRDIIARDAGVSRYKAEQAIAVTKHDKEHGTTLADDVIAGKMKLGEAVKVVNPPKRTGVVRMHVDWNRDYAIDRLMDVFHSHLNNCPAGERVDFVSRVIAMLEDVKEEEKNNA